MPWNKGFAIQDERYKVGPDFIASWRCIDCKYVGSNCKKYGFAIEWSTGPIPAGCRLRNVKIKELIKYGV